MMRRAYPKRRRKPIWDLRHPAPLKFYSRSATQLLEGVLEGQCVKRSGSGGLSWKRLQMSAALFTTKHVRNIVLAQQWSLAASFCCYLLWLQQTLCVNAHVCVYVCIACCDSCSKPLCVKGVCLCACVYTCMLLKCMYLCMCEHVCVCVCLTCYDCCSKAARSQCIERPAATAGTVRACLWSQKCKRPNRGACRADQIACR